MTPTRSYEPGAPPAGMIPLAVPEIGGNEWAYVKECLDTNWVSSVGPFVDRFEQEVARKLGLEYAVATVSGTAALHIALLICGVEPDQEVLIPSVSFIAPANAIRYVGAWPVFIDVDPHYWEMDPEAVRSFIEVDCTSRGGTLYNRRTGRQVRAILPVDILGHPVQMQPIASLAREYGLALVEDASESLGASYQGRPVGTLSDVACLSFNGNKIMTTGGGGMIATDNPRLAERARYLTTQAKDDPVEYVHNEVGYNFRLTNILAALGCAQLEHLDEFVTAKRAIAHTYAAQLEDIAGVTFMEEAEWAFSTFWLSTILIDSREFGMDRRGVLNALAHQGVQTRPLWQPLHQSRAHANAEPRACPVAVEVCERALSLPSSVGLDGANQDRVIAALHALASKVRSA